MRHSAMIGLFVLLLSAAAAPSRAEPLTPAQVQAIAKSAGVDWSKVEAKIKDGSIDQNLGTNRALAEAMSISGTPGFIIGDQILRGAPRDLASLKAIVKDVRAGKSIL